MSIKGNGIDIIEIDRIDEALERQGEHFYQKLFTPKEITYCQKYKNSSERFAGRFAAKEAIAKALGVGFGKELSYHDLEVLPDDQGKPIVFFSDKANKHFENPRILLSIAHCKKYAVASALWTD